MWCAATTHVAILVPDADGVGILLVSGRGQCAITLSVALSIAVAIVNVPPLQLALIWHDAVAATTHNIWSIAAEMNKATIKVNINFSTRMIQPL